MFDDYAQRVQNYFTTIKPLSRFLHGLTRRSPFIDRYLTSMTVFTDQRTHKDLFPARRLLVLALLLLFSLTAGAQMRKFLEDGKLYFKNQKYTLAIEQFDQFIKLYPYEAEGFYWKGNAQLKLGYFKSGRENIDQAILLSPKYIPPYVTLGEHYYNQQMYLEAIPYLLHAVKLDDQNMTVLNMLGTSCYNVQKWELAVKYFTSAIMLDSAYAPAWCNRGASRYNAQNIAEASKIDKELAEKDLDMAIKLDPKSPISYRNRAFLRLYQEKNDSAYADIQRALKLDSTDALSYYALARILYQQKKLKESLQMFDHAISKQNNRPDFYFDRSFCKVELKDFEGARADLKKYYELDESKLAIFYFYTARTYAAEQKKDMLIEYMKLAGKEDLFVKNLYYKELQKDPYFKVYEKDKDFYNLIYKIKFGKI